MKDKLKPCPFCGGKVSIEWWDEKEQCVREYEECDGNVPVYIHCHECDTETYLNAAFTPAQATEAWNMRATGWIPCNERLPEDKQIVIVWYEHFEFGKVNRLVQEVGTSFTINGKWSGFIDGSSGWQQLRIIAWMPKPEPPEV